MVRNCRSTLATLCRRGTTHARARKKVWDIQECANRVQFGPQVLEIVEVFHSYASVCNFGAKYLILKGFFASFENGSGSTFSGGVVS